MERSANAGLGANPVSAMIASKNFIGYTKQEEEHNEVEPDRARIVQAITAIVGVNARAHRRFWKTSIETASRVSVRAADNVAQGFDATTS